MSQIEDEQEAEIRQEQRDREKGGPATDGAVSVG